MHNRAIYKRLEELSTTRASVDGQVDAKVTYSDWLASQDEKTQMEVLGKSRYGLYKNGEPIDTFVNNGRTLTIKELNGKIKYTGGSFGGILDKSNEEQERFAKEYYAEIANRKEKSDIKAISKNTGFDEKKIAKVRSHIFEELHCLNGKVKKFDTSPRIALAWQRLEQGNFTDDDIMLLNHEYTELSEIKYKWDTPLCDILELNDSKYQEENYERFYWVSHKNYNSYSASVLYL